MEHAYWAKIARVYEKWMPNAQLDVRKKAVAVYGKTATNNWPKCAAFALYLPNRPVILVERRLPNSRPKTA